ncbi:UDP-N-acetylmuramoylalanine--D-glutamate ligase [Burkholderiales bacterium]|nr:UDP-N-acetylmuramoylalanine--D-glutamate ligase [Burkholderiales bacterium]
MRCALVLGLGESGLAMARWLARESWTVRVADTRDEPPMLGELRLQLPQAQFRPGPLGLDQLAGIDLLAVSPGLSLRADPVRALAAAAAQAGIETIGEMELFARALEQLRRERDYAPRIVGVTGTNGKTTTARMVAKMIERWGRSVCLAGNISPSALDALRGALDAGQLPQFWVLELSSFQLASTTSLACTAAAVLNLSQDHLDWHGSFDDYVACKRRIFAPSTSFVVNRDDPLTRAMRSKDGRGASFGMGAPEAPGQFGLVRDAGLTWLACTDEEQAPLRRRRTPPGLGGAMAAPGHADTAEPRPVHRLMPLEALAVRGTHNAMNALAALALYRAVGGPLASALRALGEFRGAPHRTETVARIGGVEYVDDSKGTNVGATVAALRGLADPAGGARRIIVILGGDGKGQTFEPLADAVRAHVRAVLLIGKDAPRIAEALQGTDVPMTVVADLPLAVHAAAALAQAGDIVLLSPACASFDAFRNYAHRAQVFAAAVRELAAGGNAVPSDAQPESLP